MPDRLTSEALSGHRRWLRLLAAMLLSAAAVGPGFAKEAAPEAADPALEARMTRITSELRCLVCQNQTIADSHADLAVDLRRQTRELLAAGKTDREVVDWMTARYGDFVLYRPPLRWTTMLLWFGPLVMLAIGFTTLGLVLRRRSRMSPAAFESAFDDDDADLDHAGRMSSSRMSSSSTGR